MATLDDVITQSGDWAADAVGTNLALIRRVQERILGEVDRHAPQSHLSVPVLDYLRAMATADPTDPEVAEWWLTHRSYSFEMLYSAIHAYERVPRPRGRPAGEPTVGVHLLVPPELLKQFDAKRGGMPRVEQIRQLMQAWVDSPGP